MYLVFPFNLKRILRRCYYYKIRNITKILCNKIDYYKIIYYYKTINYYINHYNNLFNTLVIIE